MHTQKSYIKNLTMFILLFLMTLCLAFGAACSKTDDKTSDGKPVAIVITANPEDVTLTSNGAVDLTSYLSQVTVSYNGSGTVTKSITAVKKGSESLTIADFASASLVDEGDYTVFFKVTDGTVSNEGNFKVTMPTKNIGNFDGDTPLVGWTNLEERDLKDNPYGWGDNKDKYTDGQNFNLVFQTGSLFVDSHSGRGEGEKVTFSSPTFKVFENSYISFKMAGTKDIDRVWVALVDVDTNETLAKFNNYFFGYNGRNMELTLVRYTYPVSEFAGRNVRLDFVDNAENGFGFICANDVWVNLTKDEASAILSRDKQEVLNYTLTKEVNDQGAADAFLRDTKAVYSQLEILPIYKGVANLDFADSVILNLVEKLNAVESYKADIYPLTKSIVSVTKGDVADTTSDFTAYEITESGDYVVKYVITDANGFSVERTFNIHVNIPTITTTLTNGNFEDGTNGWHVVTTEGENFGNVLSGDTTYWDFRLFIKQGEKFLTTNCPEGSKGYIYSDPVIVTEDYPAYMSFQLGACGTHDGDHVELVENGTDVVLARFYNTAFKDPHGAQTLLHYVYDISAFAGKTVYIKICDDATGGIGFVVADDFRVNLTLEQAQQVIADAKESVAQAFNGYDRGNNDRNFHYLYVSNHYDNLSIQVAKDLTVAESTEITEQLKNGSFEDGMNGWTVEGNFDNMANNDNFYFDWRPWFQDGTRHLSTRDPEGNTGSVKSSAFKVATGRSTFMSFQLGACGTHTENYVALVDSKTNEELARFYNTKFDGAAEMTMFHYIYDISAFAGKTVYIKIVDGTTSGFGLVVADDFRVNLTEEEANAVIADAKVKVNAALSHLNTDDEGQRNHVNYVTDYYNTLTIQVAVDLTDGD